MTESAAPEDTRRLFKLAYVKNLIDMGLGDPDVLDGVTDLLLAGLGEPMTQKQAGAVWNAVKAIPGAAKALITDYAVPVAKGVATAGVVIPAAAVAGGLGLGALTGATRAGLEALDDESPEEIQKEDLAGHYKRLADAAEARARSLSNSRAKQTRRAGRPVL